MLPLENIWVYFFSFSLDVDDEYEDEDPWEEGAEDILEKGEHTRNTHSINVTNSIYILLESTIDLAIHCSINNPYSLCHA